MPLGQESFMSAHLQAPSTKTTKGSAVEVEGQSSGNQEEQKQALY